MSVPPDNPHEPPKPPDVPEAWTKPPDPNWNPRRQEESGGCERVAMILGIIILVLFGTCLLVAR